jgi:uncharacterized OB-fold protein
MKEIIDAATLAALDLHGDACTRELYARLRAGTLSSTRCRACGELAYPPRSFCPRCHGRAVEWIDLPTRGTVYAFTTQERALRFSAPEVLGLVELAGVGRILTRLDAPYEALAIGDEVELVVHHVCTELAVHSFTPSARVRRRAFPGLLEVAGLRAQGASSTGKK